MKEISILYNKTRLILLLMLIFCVLNNNTSTAVCRIDISEQSLILDNVTETTIELTYLCDWANSPGATISCSGYSFSESISVGAGVGQCSFTGLTPGCEYSINIECNSGENDPNSGCIIYYVDDMSVSTMMSPPSLSFWSQGPEDEETAYAMMYILLADNSVPYSGINVYRSDGTVLSGSTGYFYDNIPYDTEISYYATVVGLSGQESGPSATIDYYVDVPPDIPLEPTNFQLVDISCTNLDFTWTDNSDNEDNFVILYKTTNMQDYEVLAILDANTTSYSQTNLIGDMDYEYLLYATNSEGDSETCHLYGWAPMCPPAAPSGFEADVVSCSKINLSWTDNSDNEDVFLIFYKTDGMADFVYLDYVLADDTTFTHANTLENTVYEYMLYSENCEDYSDPVYISATTPPCSDDHWYRNRPKTSRTNTFSAGQHNKNKTRSIVPKVPVRDLSQLDIDNDAAQLIKYMDGFGRKTQLVIPGASPTQKDIVQPVEYEDCGCKDKKPLPYTAEGDGGYRPEYKDELEEFYMLDHPDPDVDDVDDLYYQTQRDNSPLNRVLEQGAPGNTYQQHTVKYGYGTNSNEDVRFWEIINDSCINSPTNNYFFYEHGTLSMKEVKNPQWTESDPDINITRTYFDRNNRKVCHRVYIKENGQYKKVSTYYVYDAFGRLSHIIPPQADKIMEDALAAPLDQHILTYDISQDFCFINKYDKKHRLIKKKIPQKDTVFLVYDLRGRLVLTQDGNLRIDASGQEANKWKFTKYDVLNRAILTGIYTHPVALGQEQMQQYVLDNPGNLYEEETPDNYSTWMGYTVNGSFPQGCTEYLSVVYYDTYDYNRDGTDDVTYDNTDPEYDAAPWTRLKGAATGAKTRILNPTGTQTWLGGASFFDKQGRAIQSLADNHVGGMDIVRSKYSFSGELLHTTHTHTSNLSVQETVTTRTAFEYDHAGRLLRKKHKINNQPVIVLTEYYYDELGRVVEENLHSTDAGQNYLQTIDYYYNILGWVKKINDLNSNTDLYKQELFYHDATEIAGTATAPNFKGLISATKWSSALSADPDSIRGYSFTYDGLNRLVDARFGEGENLDQNVNMFSMHVEEYDLNGNIKKLTRIGKVNENSEVWDKLSYFYNGNQLMGVDDEGSADFGFQDNGSKCIIDTTEFVYDRNGNMVEDKNKGIQIEYNVLNLTQKVIFGNMANGDSIVYVYGAGGSKLQKLVYESSSLTASTHYAGAYVYKDELLNFMQSAEGRITKTTSEFVYEYHLKDHIGNVRVAFIDDNGTPKVIQESDYYPFGLRFGEQRIGNDNKYLFSGKEQQDDVVAGVSLDWYDYGARMYSAELGRWHAADPANQDFSPYSFCANDPINKYDPDGRTWFSNFLADLDPSNFKRRDRTFLGELISFPYDAPLTLGDATFETINDALEKLEERKRSNDNTKISVNGGLFIHYDTSPNNVSTSSGFSRGIKSLEYVNGVLYDEHGSVTYLCDIKNIPTAEKQYLQKTIDALNMLNCTSQGAKLLKELSKSSKAFTIQNQYPILDGKIEKRAAALVNWSNLNGAYLKMGKTNHQSDIENMKTFAHELFHALQFSTYDDMFDHTIEIEVEAFLFAEGVKYSYLDGNYLPTLSILSNLQEPMEEIITNNLNFEDLEKKFFNAVKYFPSAPEYGAYKDNESVGEEFYLMIQDYLPKLKK